MYILKLNALILTNVLHMIDVLCVIKNCVHSYLILSMVVVVVVVGQMCIGEGCTLVHLIARNVYIFMLKVITTRSGSDLCSILPIIVLNISVDSYRE